MLPYYDPDPLLKREWHDYCGGKFSSLINSTLFKFEV